MFEFALIIAAFFFCASFMTWVNKLVKAAITKTSFGGYYFIVMAVSFTYIVWYFGTN